MISTVIYTVGACKNVSLEVSDKWRKDTQEFFDKFYLDHKVYVININDFYNYSETYHTSEREVMLYCLRQASQADIILCNFDNLLTSKGSTAELTAAYISGIPIIGFCTNPEEPMYSWDKEYCDRIFTGPRAQEDAMQYIEDYYVLKYR